MHPPCEIMVDVFLPAVRGLVAHELSSRGVGQTKIAAALWVTQASVSQYLFRNPEEYMKKIEGLGVDRSTIEAYVGLLSEDVMKSPVDSVLTLYSLWRGLMATGKIRHSHVQGITVSTQCEVCETLFGVPRLEVERSRVLIELEAAVRRIESSSDFGSVMPHVGVNLVLSADDAKDEKDVAGVPGRIVKAHDRAKATMRPEYGVSRHMAQMLLTARRFNPSFRATINVKHDRRISSILKGMQLQVGTTADKSKLKQPSGDIVVAALQSSLERLGNTPPVIVDRGGPGLEPITYLFGSTAQEVVDRALEIARRYVGS